MVNIIVYKVCWWTTVATGCSEITTRWRPFGISSLIYSEQRCQTSALRFFGSWDFVPDVILICVCAWACNLRLRRRRQLRLRWRFWVACVEWLGLPLVFLVLGFGFGFWLCLCPVSISSPRCIWMHWAMKTTWQNKTNMYVACVWHPVYMCRYMWQIVGMSFPISKQWETSRCPC